MINKAFYHRLLSRNSLVLVALIALFCKPLMAVNNVHVNGFISQGIQQAQQTNFVNQDGDVSFELTEIGINGGWQFDEQLGVNGQVVYLNAGNRYPEGFRLDYLFLDWHAVSRPNLNVNIHIGRYKNYHWMYSATRDVPHTRPNNLLPQSIYFDSFRDIALGSDGIAIRANASNDLGDWVMDWSYGSSPINQQSTQQLLGPDADGKIEQEFTHQASAYWHSQSSDWMLGFNLLDSDFRYFNTPNDSFVMGNATVQRLSLVAQYQTQYWELASEILRERSIYSGVLFDGFSNDSSAEGGYVQFTWLPTARLDLMIRLDLYDLDRDDRNGQLLALSSNGAIPNYFGFMDTGTLGLKFQLHDNLQLQAEVNRVRGAGRLTPLLVKDAQTANSEYWNMWSIQLMYWF